jgi:sulfur-oxidizing protein SoxX
MNQTTRTMALGALAFTLLAGGYAHADPTRAEVKQVLEESFQAKGIVKMSALDQDALQQVCTDSGNNPPSTLAKALESDQMKTVQYPADGQLMGDWKRGEKIAESGKGMTWKDKPGSVNGGSCYNCHQIAPTQPSYGTIGPSLYRFGKTRGDGVEMQKYVYAKIYNAKAFNLCSAMPRFGYAQALTEQQIKDLVALLLSPDSPNNR